MKILTSRQMREIDRLTVERCRISYPILMENAGARVVEAISETWGTVAGSHCAVFCGKGNNGGDGAVIARLLWLKGADEVEVFLFGKVGDTSGEARANFEIIRELAAAESERHNPFKLSFHEIDEEFTELGAGYDLVIDAIFGTGLTRPAAGLYARAIETINLIKRYENARVVSVDIPSGLPSDSETTIGPHVEADLTVTFTAPKIGNALPPACHANGRLIIGRIGTPEWLIEEESGSRLELIEQAQVAAWLEASRRHPDAHKGAAGDILLIAGSRGKTGAAALAAESALRSGAGLVTVATAESAQKLLITQTLPEIMTESLEELDSGAISIAALERALDLASNRTVIAIGPGLSSAHESTRRFVLEFLLRRTAPVVIDADGLNALAPWPDELQGSEELPIVITPHPGEMARLTGKTSAEIVADRIGISREFAAKHRLITVLKGQRTIIASSGGIVYVNPTGNAGMATAGSGDVLTGLAAGFLAQHPRDDLSATIAAVFLHGRAGDLAADLTGMRPVIASSIIEQLSRAILETAGDRERPGTTPITKI